jgi:GNAT superfamily N-acetyltransferase
MSKITGLLVAGGVFGAVAASALATSVAPAPAQALDACFSSALTGTLKTGGASCSSAGPLQWAIAIGANTYAEVAGGLFNLAIAVGDDSLAYTTPDVGGTSYFNIATAAAGGTAGASDGIFQIATAPSMRRKGLGRKIVTSLMAWGRQQGGMRAYLQVVATNHPARRLYQGLGFKPLYPYTYYVRDETV